MSKAPTPKIISKKHKARVEREQIQRRWIVTIAAVIGVIIILVLLYGVLDQTVLKSQKPVAKVGNEVIRSDQFIKQVQFQRYQLNQQALQYESFKQLFGSDANNSAYIDSLIQQIQTQMDDNVTLAGSVLDNMINDIVIANFAKANDITVSDDEVNTKFQEDFSFYPNGTPTPKPTSPILPTSTLNPTQYAIITATPTAEPTTEPTATTELPTETPSASTATLEATAEATPDVTSTPYPTATPFTQEGYQAEYKAMVERFSAINFNESDLKNLMRTQLIGQKVYENVTKDVPLEEEQVWARHILVATLEEALAVKNRLNNGEDFAAIAAEVSTDSANKDSGGDLGWFGTGVMDPAFEEATYKLNVGEISDPVQSTSGYHIIQLLGKEVRPLTDAQLSQKKQTVFNDWLTAEKTKITIEKYDSVWQSIAPTEPAFMTQAAQ